MQWSKRLIRISTRSNIVLGLLLTLTLGTIMMALIQPQMVTLSGGLPILDSRLFYNAQDVNQLFTALGAIGRLLYSYQQVVDSIFPAAYGITLALVLVKLVNKTSPQASRIRMTVFLPFFAALTDYAENCLIATQLASFPVLSEGVILTAAIMTIAKWALIVSVVGTVLALGLVAVRRREHAQL